MTLLLAALLAAAQPAQPAQPSRPVACVLERLDRAYLSGLWLRMNGPGIEPGGPEARDLEAAVAGCSDQLNWRERDRTFATYYALAQGHFEMVAPQRLPREEDREQLTRAVFDFAPANLTVLERDPDGAPLGTAAKAEFQIFLGQANPELMRRSDYEILWAVAQPLLIAQIMKAHFALGEILP
jgi:hypothetical protein